MKRIDRETVQKIIDTADIVDVVSDFVALKRRGANYVGLCPFHNDRSPSFYVSKSKGICKCFSCGKGGSPVNFLMELEQMSFNEALRYLAKKYNIEIKEQELTDEERQRDSDRENMLAINDFAMNHFENILHNTDDGRDIGLAYFRERGISDAAITKFHLGYAHENRTDLYDTAIKKGYNPKYLVDTGLCVHTDDNRYYDRFRGRVIYPIFSISGKVLGFGGRTLRSDKHLAKYVNSPESIVYVKNRELYGLYQAKQSIAKKNKCILVEGYMDVISMSQSGVENVVASSGTSLTEGQIKLIHRFTDNVTVIYDSDAAGIKASLRGIDMLLSEGLNIKVVLLPDGDDPDSFAQNHSSTEVEEYIEAHETDFIRFKTRILLEGAENDPLKRSKVISEIVQTISVIPDEITRTVYISECSRTLSIDEIVLTQQVAKYIAQRRIAQKEKYIKEKTHAEIDTIEDNPPLSPPPGTNPPTNVDHSNQLTSATSLNAPAGMKKKKKGKELTDADIVEPFEKELAQYVLRYGALTVDLEQPGGNVQKIMVADYIFDELQYNKITFLNPPYMRLIEECISYLQSNWANDFTFFAESSRQQQQREWEEGENKIRQTAVNLEQIETLNKQLILTIEEAVTSRDSEFREKYLITPMASSADDVIRTLATAMMADRDRLSNIHFKYTKPETDKDRVEELISKAFIGLKDAHLQCKVKILRRQLKELTANPGSVNNPNQRLNELMIAIRDLDIERSKLAKKLGERVISPS